MTAVNPTRLRFQIQGVISFFESPEEFHRRLSDLFSSYGNRALRFGESASAIPLVPMYHLPHPVMRQLKLDLIPQIQANPQAALNLSDSLWLDDYFEVLQTAIFILGNVPIKETTQIVARIKEWLSPSIDPLLATQLFSVGTKSLQSRLPEAWESLVYTYLSDQNPKLINFGLIGLIEGIKSPSFTNLPAAFRLTSPFLRDPYPGIMRSLERLIKTLAQHAPIETAFYLKQALSISESAETVRLVKNAIIAFPENLQKQLKSAVKRDL